MRNIFFIFLVIGLFSCRIRKDILQIKPVGVYVIKIEEVDRYNMKKRYFVYFGDVKDIKNASYILEVDDISSYPIGLYKQIYINK